MTIDLLDFFTHPLFRGPTWGTLLLSVVSSLMGVILFFQRRSLLSESLSHAAWPGILLFSWLQAAFFPHFPFSAALILGGGWLFALLAFRCIQWMEKSGKVTSDAALSFILASFFGFGTLLASHLQFSFPKSYSYAEMALFGQAAIMDDGHILLYGLLALVVASFLFFSFRPLQLMLFDPHFAKVSGLKVAFLEKCLIGLLLVSLIFGIQSVGVLLISGMSIAPAIAARQFTDRLHRVLLLAALFGGLSGLIGNWLSLVGTIALKPLTLPTGPMIIVVGAAFAYLSLLFAPKRGLFFRWARILRFRLRCLEENILKGFWKKGALPFKEIRRSHQTSRLHLLIALFLLAKEGWMEKEGKNYQLSSDGRKRASVIVRLHRLWELYLASTLGLEREKVHLSAEEMEHILTPDLEERLTRLLLNPQRDPHNQEIPARPSL